MSIKFIATQHTVISGKHFQANETVPAELASERLQNLGILKAVQDVEPVKAIEKVAPVQQVSEEPKKFNKKYKKDKQVKEELLVEDTSNVDVSISENA